MKHSGTLQFETERLICRRFEPCDCEDMYNNWAADPMIQLEYGEPVYDDISGVKTLLDTYISGYNNPDFYRWAIIEKDSGQNIGQIALCRVYSDCSTAEAEYCIGQRFWGRGYAGEALSGMIAFLFENTGFLRIEAYHRAENTKSGRVLERSMMHKTDTVERFRRQGISPEGEVCYCIERENYNK